MGSAPPRGSPGVCHAVFAPSRRQALPAAPLGGPSVTATALPPSIDSATTRTTSSDKPRTPMCVLHTRLSAHTSSLPEDPGLRSWRRAQVCTHVAHVRGFRDADGVTGCGPRGPSAPSPWRDRPAGQSSSQPHAGQRAQTGRTCGSALVVSDPERGPAPRVRGRCVRCRARAGQQGRAVAGERPWAARAQRGPGLAQRSGPDRPQEYTALFFNSGVAGSSRGGRCTARFYLFYLKIGSDRRAPRGPTASGLGPRGCAGRPRRRAGVRVCGLHTPRASLCCPRTPGPRDGAFWRFPGYFRNFNSFSL